MDAKESCQLKVYSPMSDNFDEFSFCYKCRKFVHLFCSRHPVIKVSDSPICREGSCTCSDYGLSHAVISIPPCLRVAPSQFKSNGNQLAVWSEELIPCGTIFGPFRGRQEFVVKVKKENGDVTTDGVKPLKMSWYVHKSTSVSVPFFIEGGDPAKSNWMQFVTRLSELSNFDKYNVVAMQFRGGIYYRACKNIRADRELVVHFGTELPDCNLRTNEMPSPSELIVKQDEIVKFSLGNLPPPPPVKISKQEETFDFCPLKVDDKSQIFESATTTFHCSLCPKSYSTQSSLRTHEQRKHAHSMKPISCTLCKKTFFAIDNIDWHMAVHRDVHECDICHQQFYVLSKLRMHMRKHKKPKPARRKSTAKPIRRKTISSNFECTICGKCFTSAGNLNVHREIHNEFRVREKCYICDRTFSTICNLRRHLNIVHRTEESDNNSEVW